MYTNFAPNVYGGIVMPKAKKAPRKKKAQRAPVRPVLSVRVPEGLYASISAEAAALGVSNTEVVYRRLMAYQHQEWKPRSPIPLAFDSGGNGT